MANLWIALAFLSAFTLATSDALTKKALAYSNEYLTALFRLLFSLPFLLVLWIFIPAPKLNSDFYKAFAFALPLEIIALVWYIKALRISPLSLTLPFLAITPVFLIFTSYIIVGEKVSLWGSIGIIFLAFGSYTMNIHEMRRGIIEPFKAIQKEKGSVLMMGVALIYSITASLGKVAVENSSPLFFGITYYIVLTAFFAPFALWMGRSDLKGFISEKRFIDLLLPGFFSAIMVASHMLAISLAKVAYVISVKRTSLIIGVIYGYLFFREKNIKERLLGAALMFIGFVIIVTAV